MNKNKTAVSEMLTKARKYEEEMAKIPISERAAFHLCAPIGWINDPNGFSFYKGACHLFYQYHPYGTFWGPMHWGHSVTRDFIRWEQLPAALAPDMDYDAQGCFSGSALEYGEKHILMYTGVIERFREDGSRFLRQQQCIAVGDGRNYKKIENNPVIKAELLPEGSSPEDFRDPKIWREKGKFYAVAGSRAADGSGQIPLFESEDLKKWSFVTVLERCNHEYGCMWECPDFFPLGKEYVLLLSPQDMNAMDLEFHNGNGTMYLLGSYEESTHKFQRKRAAAIDYGLDFYAPQTLLAPDGRRIMIGWMQSWDNHICPGGRTWSGMMSVPRELFVKEGKLLQRPVRELESYRKNKVTHNITSEAGNAAPLSLSGIRGRIIDLTVNITEGQYRCFTMEVAESKDFHTSIIYDAQKEVLSFDRTYSGLVKDYIATRSMRVRKDGGKIKLRVLMDKYSCEIFVNDGEQAMSSLLYTPLEADEITFRSDGAWRMEIEKYDVEV